MLGFHGLAAQDFCYHSQMAQANPRPVVTSVKGTYKPRWRKRLAIIFLLLVITLAGFLFVKHIQHDRAIAKERSQYAAAESDLNNLADQIVAKFGKPADRQTDNYCGHTSVEFGTGDLYCDTEVYLLYGTSGLENSISLAKSIEGTGLRGGKIKQEYDPSISADSVPPASILSESFSSSTLECIISYSHFLQTNLVDLIHTHNLSFGSTTSGLVIEAGCSARNPKAEYYPTQD